MRDLISEACRQHVELPFELVKNSAPETILELLATSGGTQHARALVPAELFLQEAELNVEIGNRGDAQIRRAQAFELIRHNLAPLSSEEQVFFRAKLAQPGPR